MEEYEVELIDYLRVIWKGKWVIFACLVVALATAAAVTVTRPKEFTASICYYVREGFASGVLSGFDVKEVALLVEEAAPLSFGKAVRVKVKPDTDRFNITLVGAIGEGAFPNVVVQLTSLVEGIVKQQAERRYDETITGIELQLEEKTRERDIFRVRLLNELRGERREELIRRVELQVEQMTWERDILQEQMAEITGSEDPRLFSLATEIIALETSIVKRRQALDALRSADLDDLFLLERTAVVVPGDPRLSVFAKGMDRLDTSISELTVAFEVLRTAKMEDLMIVSLVREPTITTTKGNIRLTLAVATVLGLFVGVLLAFFVHYLAAVREREKKRAKS